jgi:hypothetical protein
LQTFIETCVARITGGVSLIAIEVEHTIDSPLPNLAPQWNKHNPKRDFTNFTIPQLFRFEAPEKTASIPGDG